VTAATGRLCNPKATTMIAPNQTDPSIAALQDDIAALKRDVSKLIEHLQEGAATSARSTAEQIDDGVQRLYRNVAAEGDRAVKGVSRQIEEQPLVALLIALGVGYIGGRLLSR
jgi:ElaB/YqjD/DUF883 family membrane-anchored ribosome-binding protein